MKGSKILIFYVTNNDQNKNLDINFCSVYARAWNQFKFRLKIYKSADILHLPVKKTLKDQSYKDFVSK